MRALLLFSLLTVMAIPAAAQNTEIYAGVSVTRSDPNFSKPSFRFNDTTDQLGFNAALTRYFGDSPFGINGDLGATWSMADDDTRLLTLMGGPVVKARKGRVQPFGHGLVGVGRLAAKNQQLSFSFNKANTGISWAAGGGIDIRLNDRVGIRAISADYLGTRILDKNVRYLRAGVGLTFSF
jgi:hypothetical protein